MYNRTDMYNAAKTLVAKIDSDKRQALIKENESIDNTQRKVSETLRNDLFEKTEKFKEKQYKEAVEFQAKQKKDFEDYQKSLGVVYDTYGYITIEKTPRQKQIAKEIKAIDDKQNTAYKKLLEAIDKSVIEQSKINLEEILKG